MIPNNEYNRLTFEHYADTWRSNYRQNEPYIAESKSFQKQGKRCVIAGAGASLDHCIQFLKNDRNNENFILSTDTAIRPLVKNGIRPNGIITIDPQKDIRHFVGAVKNTPMVAYTTSNPAITQWHTGEKYFINNPACIVAELAEINNKNLPLIGAGGNVSTVALSFAEYVGYTDIALVGVDLLASYGKSYAQGCLRSGISPKEVTNGFNLAKTWVEDFINEKNHVKVTNVTRYGVFFKGARNILI